MQLIVGDTEVFAHDWVACFYNINTQQWSMFHNDENAFKTFISQPDTIFCGYNNKHYDNFIWKALACGASPEMVKNINDFIIKEEREGWDHFFLKQHRFWFDSFDLMDDTQEGTSLKAFEAHSGYNIEETQVDFDLDRALTGTEVGLTIKYCQWDVMATCKLLTVRRNYLEAKLNVARTIGISPARALYMTNAKLTATALGARAVIRYDERDYQYPENVAISLLPQAVIAFFDRMHDPSISDAELFKSSLSIDLDGAEAVLGFGGIHHARLNYREEATDTRVIVNFDVSSLYPSLMVYYNFISRNIPDGQTFVDFYHTRIAAKKSGDKRTANVLKLILNTTYGASLAKTNPLYDPLMGRSICITGQLFILELAIRYMRATTTTRVIQLNTDGIMISIDKSELDTIYAINDAWMKDKKLDLEEDDISLIVQKDVNNYIMVYTDGHLKTKGSYVTWGIPGAGAFSINNNFTIVKKAVVEYFTKGTPVEDTINGCNDIHEFQIIAKAGSKYKAVYMLPPDYDDYKKRYCKANRVKALNKKGVLVWRDPVWTWDDYTGPREQVQRCNRVYASADYDRGTLYKVKPDGTVGKIGGAPDHCIIDNRNQLTVDAVDRSWYIDLANKYVADYTGVCV